MYETTISLPLSYICNIMCFLGVVTFDLIFLPLILRPLLTLNDGR